MKSKIFLVGFFAAAALIGGASVYFSATIDRAERAVTRVVSPDGRFQAVRLSFAMGGDKPSCVDTIAVMLAVYPEHFAEKNKNYEVYSAPCATAGRRGASPKIEWTSSTTLSIVHPPLPAGADDRIVKKTRDLTKSVRIAFMTG